MEVCTVPGHAELEALATGRTGAAPVRAASGGSVRTRTSQCYRSDLAPDRLGVNEAEELLAEIEKREKE